MSRGRLSVEGHTVRVTVNEVGFIESGVLPRSPGRGTNRGKMSTRLSVSQQFVDRVPVCLSLDWGPPGRGVSHVLGDVSTLLLAPLLRVPTVPSSRGLEESEVVSVDSCDSRRFR